MGRMWVKSDQFADPHTFIVQLRIIFVLKAADASTDSTLEAAAGKSTLIMDRNNEWNLGK